MIERREKLLPKEILLKKNNNNKNKRNVNEVYFDGSHCDVMHVIWEAELRLCSGVQLP